MFVVAVALEFVFHYIVFDEFQVIGALLAGIILAVMPYLLVRGPVNRVM